MNGLLKASSTAKQTLLSLSPFHYSAEGVRALQMGLGPFETMRLPELTLERPARAMGEVTLLDHANLALICPQTCRRRATHCVLPSSLSTQDSRCTQLLRSFSQ